MCSCYSIPERYNLFSEVELSTRSFCFIVITILLGADLHYQTFWSSFRNNSDYSMHSWLLITGFLIKESVLR